jgi:hypothetical protein
MMNQGWLKLTIGKNVYRRQLEEKLDGDQHHDVRHEHFGRKSLNFRARLGMDASRELNNRFKKVSIRRGLSA